MKQNTNIDPKKKELSEVLKRLGDFLENETFI